MAGGFFVFGCRSSREASDGTCADFSGMWDTYFGYMHLEQEGTRVSGKYHSDIGVIRGTVKGDTFFFTWRDHQGSGRGYFVMAPEGKSFSGVYKILESRDARPEDSWDGQWNGVRISR